MERWFARRKAHPPNTEIFTENGEAADRARFGHSPAGNA
jgi:hypothetical protein